jgi:uncharacterized protein
VKWRRTKNPDVIDRRGAPGGRAGTGGGIPIPLPGGTGGRVGGGLGLLIVLAIVALQVFGGGEGEGLGIPDAFDDRARAPGSNRPAPIPRAQDPEAELKDFSTFVFTDAQETWSGTFSGQGEDYDGAQMVLFRDAVRTGGCGSATSAVGPFYCPGDQRVYLDLGFYDELSRELGAPGDFAWAYVIAHEMGHHVQRQLGTEAEVREAGRSDPGLENELSVRLELQADCYAGVWGSTVTDLLERGDLDEAFVATEAIGDDRLQQRGGGSANPDTFTHGSSEQRRKWFETGLESGDPAACDTFSADEL